MPSRTEDGVRGAGEQRLLDSELGEEELRARHGGAAGVGRHDEDGAAVLHQLVSVEARHVHRRRRHAVLVGVRDEPLGEALAVPLLRGVEDAQRLAR
eukprot:scaffold111110_cov60-Phaeocystis_antarctica.AAC.2